MAGQNQVLGSGKLYFEKFATGTMSGNGEMYFGNTPTLSLTRSETKLDHWDADNGKRVKDKSVSLSEESTGQFSTDNITPANLALWFAGDSNPITVASGTAITETFTDVIQDRYYQLGKTASTPSGARKVTNVVVKIATATIPPAGNYTVDLALGRIHVLPGAAAIPAEADLIVTYDQAAYTRSVVIAKGQQIEGSLRFISNNSEGDNSDHYYPYVKLTASGDYQLKGEEWQVLTFDIEVLNYDENTSRAYIDARPA